MTDLRIRRLRKHYLLPESGRDERTRLDRVLARALDDQLFDAALDRAGVPGTEEICIRSVGSVVRLRRTESDAHLAATWSIALAEAIARRLREGGPEVVRYGSRHQVLAEMLRDISRGDLSRAWAWRQLGLWTRNDGLPPEAACRAGLVALAGNPHAIVAVLHLMAKEGRFPALLAGVSAADWSHVAREALIAAGASARTAEVLGAEFLPRLSALAPEAEGIVRRSAIARAIRTSLGAWPLPAAVSFGALALLECAPELAASENAKELVFAITALLVRPSTDTGTNGGRRETYRSPASRPAWSSAADTALANATPMQDNPGAASSEPDTAPQSELQPADDRARGQTGVGGLLFLLHLVRALDIQSVPQREPSLSGRPLRWVLHQLALRLALVDAADPAALAFAGLAPGSEPPSSEEAPATESESMAIQSLRDTLVAALRARLSPDSEDGDSALLARVVPRAAEIVSDPAWIEVRFALADATIDVRRAGLDIDLGWIPWLGVVVRFVYA